MIISSVYINAFKSIQDLQIPLDEKTTVLIGPNESGKTNILKAIETFRPDKTLSHDHTCQYSDSYSTGKYPLLGLEITGFSE